VKNKTTSSVRFFSSLQRWNPLVNTTFRSGEMAIFSQETPNSFFICPTLQKQTHWIPGFDEGLQMHRLGARGGGGLAIEK
jgi:hypothetical protein